jgi:hypothetical protein
MLPQPNRVLGEHDAPLQQEQEVFAKDLEKMWSSANVAPNPEEHTLIRNEYLQVTAIRK